MPVELLTAGMWHDSIGDLAVMQAMLVELGRRGLPCVPAFKSSGTMPCIIGGGALLSRHRRTRWAHALEPCRVPGPHVLNAVSVDGSGDFHWLREYRYVSVRDPASARHLAPHVQATVVPCPAVLLQPPEIDRTFPTFEFIPAAPYAVVDCDLAAVPLPGLRKVVVDTRPWAKRSTPASFTHRNPDVLLVVLKQAQLAICNTLHLSILALATGTPFAIDQRSRKCRDYWSRRCPALLAPSEALAATALALRDEQQALRLREQAAAHRHLDRIVEILREKKCTP